MTTPATADVRKEIFEKVDGNGLTPTQRKMLRVLCDGEAHTRQELHACLPDELSALSSIHKHLHNLKAWLKPKGYLIRCVLVGGNQGTIPHYQMMRHLASCLE